MTSSNEPKQELIFFRNYFSPKFFHLAFSFNKDTINNENTAPIEVPEIMSAEQRCFRNLTFFSADSENMENLSADQRRFRADQL